MRVSNAFLLGTPLRLSLQCVPSRVPSSPRSLNPKAADSGKSGHTQYVFVYANNAGCPEEHFESGTLSHGRDDDEGIQMCMICVLRLFMKQFQITSAYS